MSDRKKIIQATIVSGLALFAMFLGAGNIIFPPYLGAASGVKWPISTLGFILSGTGLPLLGVLAVAKSGGTADTFSERVGPRFAKALNTAVLIMIGPLFCIPRTAATTCELSFMPYLGDNFEYKTVLVVGGAIFFAICTLLAIEEGQTLDKIGKYLTPILAVFLFYIVILSIIKPLGQPGLPTTRSLFPEGYPVPESVNSKFFLFGFTNGYQTMDGMGSIVLASGVVMTLYAKGFSKEESSKMLKYIGLIAGVGLSLVYIGFNYLGATGSNMGLQEYVARTELTVAGLEMLAGGLGKALLATIIFFACITTATGLLTTFADYFKNLSKGKLKYKPTVITTAIIAYTISTLGVENIISLAGPVLDFMYPLIIVLIMMNMFGRYIKYDYSFKGAVIATSIFSFIMVLTNIDSLNAFANSIIKAMPLGAEGFAYLLPAIIGGLVGGIIESNQRKQKKNGNARALKAEN